MTPALQTERLHLSRYVAGFVLDRHVEWLNDPEVVKYSEQRHKQHTEASQHKYLNEFPGESHIWLIKIVEHPDPPPPLRGGPIHYTDIGTITAYIDEPNRLANMGIMIGEKETWGQGYGLEAWTAVMDRLFTKAGIRKIEAGMMVENFPMKSICSRSDMVYDGYRREHFLLDGRPVDLVYYGLTDVQYHHNKKAKTTSCFP